MGKGEVFIGEVWMWWTGPGQNRMSQNKKGGVSKVWNRIVYMGSATGTDLRQSDGVGVSVRCLERCGAYGLRDRYRFETVGRWKCACGMVGMVSCIWPARPAQI